ncbi:MAG: TAXI family TRAP transporter solute-binding subunit [Dehalococcoidia bacterium]
MKRVFLISLAVILAISMVVVGCPEPIDDDEEPDIELPEVLSWGSRGTGPYNILSVGFLTLVDTNTPITVAFREAASLAAAISMMRDGELEIFAFSLRDLGHAYRGTAELEEMGKSDIRLILAGYQSDIGFFTAPRTGATTIEDMAGLRVSYSSVRAPIFTDIGAAILEYYGILGEIIDVPNVPKAEKLSGILEGTLDVSLEGFDSGNPQELMANIGVVYLPISEECAAYVHEQLGYTTTGTVKAGAYGGIIDHDTIAISGVGGVACDATLTDDTVYEIVKAIYDNYAEVLPIHELFEMMVLEKAAHLSATVPYHEGAIRYYKEQGVWSAEMEALQQKLLAQQ